MTSHLSISTANARFFFLPTAQKKILRSQCKWETSMTNYTLPAHSCLITVEKSIQFLAFLREVLPNKIQNDEC